MTPPERDRVDEIVEQWAEQRPDLDASPALVIGRMSRLSRELEQRLERTQVAHGLEPGWFDVLASLRRAGEPFRLRPSAFAKGLMLTSSATTKRLDRMEAAGLVRRTPDPDDRRAILIEMTEAGRRAVDEAATAHFAHEDELLAGLSRKEREQLAALLRKLGRGLPPRA